jgi:zinc transport system substrate-binding protein
MRIVLMQITRRLASAAIAGCTVLALAACGTDDAGADPDRTIAAGFYPLAWVSAEVAGDTWTVDNLTGTGGDPHNLSIGLAQTAALEGAALVVTSTGLQPHVDSTVESVARGHHLDAADVVDLVPVEDHERADEAHEHGEHADEHGDEHSDEHGEEAHEDDHGDAAHDDHEGHDHGDEDPHFWHDPLRMAALADAVAEELSELDPEGADGYAERAADVRAELEALDSEFTDGLANCERDVVVVSHDAFGYLTRYGLSFAAIAGLSPDAEPSPAALGNLQRLIREEGITTVFSERLASAKMAETLASDLGLDTAVLDPIEGLTDETADEDYLSLMRTNLETLRKANNCS